MYTKDKQSENQRFPIIPKQLKCVVETCPTNTAATAAVTAFNLEWGYIAPVEKAYFQEMMEPTLKTCFFKEKMADFLDLNEICFKIPLRGYMFACKLIVLAAPALGIWE